MDTNKDNNSILDRLDNIERRLLQSDTEYAKQYLADEGINVEEELKFSEQFMKKIRFLVKALSKQRQDQSLLEIAFKRVKEAIQVNAKETTDTLIALLETKTPSVQYRKLEEWSDNEIRDVLADVDLVKLLEELEKEIS
ncbi:MAG: hypothetical protein IH597_08855 [Bacteroidales bacterium]|nr:hypothetical protein [Bacteroidales bacterium]